MVSSVALVIHHLRYVATSWALSTPHTIMTTRAYWELSHLVRNWDSQRLALLHFQKNQSEDFMFLFNGLHRPLSIIITLIKVGYL